VGGGEPVTPQVERVDAVLRDESRELAGNVPVGVAFAAPGL
jgi:hypothetical protein